MAPCQIVDRVRNPLCAHFDDADAKFGEALRDPVIDQRMERADHGELEFAEARFVEKKIVRRNAAVGGVHAYGQIELTRFSI